jgi:hypothetical protein
MLDGVNKIASTNNHSKRKQASIVAGQLKIAPASKHRCGAIENRVNKQV